QAVSHDVTHRAVLRRAVRVLVRRRPLPPTLFPYTTLFRSGLHHPDPPAVPGGSAGLGEAVHLHGLGDGPGLAGLPEAGVDAPHGDGEITRLHHRRVQHRHRGVGQVQHVIAAGGPDAAELVD